MYKKIIFLLLCFAVGIGAKAQRQTAEEYIEKYKETAIREMQRSGIPASITLAQGILESGNGNSRLAQKGNNHFGIKCHHWTGKRIFEDDDRQNECFRKYQNANESFIDHSDFLTGKSRYAFLFDLDSRDYKAWAKGLKKAGYATARDYAHRLIGLIERYELYRYDDISTRKIVAYKKRQTQTQTQPTYAVYSHKPIKDRIRYRNGVPYFIVMQGDTYEKIKRELGISSRRIAKRNDFQRYKPLILGEPIYLKRKKKRTPHKYPIHIADGKETLHDISQHYAIRLKVLANNNGMRKNEIPYEGQHVILR